MADRAAEFRRRAEEADAWAGKTSHLEERAKFEEIARQWRELADRAEHGGPGLHIDIDLPPGTLPDRDS